jgi:hypothetical protein
MDLSDEKLTRSLLRSPFAVEPLLDASAEQGALLCLLHLFRALPVRSRDASDYVRGLQDAALFGLVEAFRQGGDLFAWDLLLCAMQPGIKKTRRWTRGMENAQIEQAFKDAAIDLSVEQKVAATLIGEMLRNLFGSFDEIERDEEAGERLAGMLASGLTEGEVMGAEARQPTIKETEEVVAVWGDAADLSEVEREVLLGSFLGNKCASIGARLSMTEEAVKQCKHRIKVKLERIFSARRSQVERRRYV